MTAQVRKKPQPNKKAHHTPKFIILFQRNHEGDLKKSLYYKTNWKFQRFIKFVAQLGIHLAIYIKLLKAFLLLFNNKR